MSALLEIVALARAGKWNEAHALVQDDASKHAAWLHGILHVQEGDLANAEYWYRKAGRDFAGRGVPGVEFDALEAELTGTGSK